MLSYKHRSVYILPQRLQHRAGHHKLSQRVTRSHLVAPKPATIRFGMKYSHSVLIKYSIAKTSLHMHKRHARTHTHIRMYMCIWRKNTIHPRRQRRRRDSLQIENPPLDAPRAAKRAAQQNHTNDTSRTHIATFMLGDCWLQRKIRLGWVVSVRRTSQLRMAAVSTNCINAYASRMFDATC